MFVLVSPAMYLLIKLPLLVSCLPVSLVTLLFITPVELDKPVKSLDLLFTIGFLFESQFSKVFGLGGALLLLILFLFRLV